LPSPISVPGSRFSAGFTDSSSFTVVENIPAAPAPVTRPAAHKSRFRWGAMPTPC
jgi:hypothetical protein